MQETSIALLVFVCLLTASLGSLFTHDKLPARLRDEETHAIVKSVAGIFALLISLVLGLTMNSARNTFESVDRNVHSIATDIIVLDRALEQYGEETAETRRRLLVYAQRAVSGRLHEDGAFADRTSETLLNDVGASLRAVTATDADRRALLNSMLAQYHSIVEMRWILVEQLDGTVPTALLVMIVIWLMLVFASYGYRAPRNEIVVGGFVVASALMAAAIYLVIDMDVPFSGPIQVSPAPLERAIAEMKRL